MRTAGAIWWHTTMSLHCTSCSWPLPVVFTDMWLLMNKIVLKQNGGNVIFLKYKISFMDLLNLNLHFLGNVILHVDCYRMQ